jgi:predicted nucleotidyltransferase
MNPKRGNQKIDDLAKQIVPILLREGVVQASVFGSFARGEATGDSDLDILVNYRDGVSLFDVGGLKIELEKILGRKVDLVSQKYLKPRLKNFILQDQIRIL